MTEFIIDNLRYRITSDTDMTVEVIGVESKLNLNHVNIPNKVKYYKKEYSVTDIGTAFRYCSSLSSVTIPNSVTSIGDAAFSGCI